MTVRGCREDITWWWSGSVNAPWPPWVRTGSRLCAGASGPRGPSSPAGPTQTREWEPLTLTANQRACWETAGNLQSLQSLIQKQKLVTITLDECEAPAEWSVFHFISHLAEAPTPQVSARRAPTLLSVLMVTLSCGRTRSTSRFHSVASTVDSRISSGLEDVSASCQKTDVAASSKLGANVKVEIMM